MKAKHTYLKGKSIFTVSLIVIGVTVLTVYLSGINYNRTVTANLYLSLSIIAACLFLFLSYGLYRGVELVDNFPKYRDFKSGDLIGTSGETPDLPSVDVGDDIGGIILSIFLWIAMSILFLVLLIVFEAVLWFSIFIILSMLYWVFFRALKFVFYKSNETKGRLELAIFYAIGYTALFTGWIFGIVYLAELLA
ncbi:MAG: hypothetical protein AB8G22_22450 [Saprospiraceae bacterium]